MQTTFKKGEKIDLPELMQEAAFKASGCIEPESVIFNGSENPIVLGSDTDSELKIQAKKIIINGSKDRPVTFTEKIEITLL